MTIKDLLFNKTNNTFYQFTRYIFVGAVATVADFSLLYILTEFAGLHYLISAALAFIAGALVNFSLCTIWIFPGSKYNMTKGFVLFFTIGIVGLILNEIILFILVDLFDMWYMLAKAFSTIIVLFWNFFARKKLVFT